MTQARVTSVALIILICAACSTTAIAQEIGVLGSKLWTKSADIGHPVGVGAFAALPLGGGFHLAGEYFYNKTLRTYNGTTSDDELGQNPVSEQITGDTRLQTVRIEILKEIINIDPFSLRIGVGAGMCFLANSSHGLVTGRDVPTADATKQLVATSLRVRTGIGKIGLWAGATKFLWSRSSLVTNVRNPFSPAFQPFSFIVGVSYELIPSGS